MRIGQTISFSQCVLFSTSYRTWFPNPQRTSLFYTAREHVCNLCMYCKNYTILMWLRIPLTTIFKVLPAKQPRITSVAICRKSLESHHLRGTEIALKFLTRSIINCSDAIGSYIKTKWNDTCFLNACIFQRNRTEHKKIQLHYPLNCWLTPLRLDDDSALFK